MAAFSSGHALVVGVGQYQDTAWNVSLTTNEARDIALALQVESVAGYPKEQVRLILDEKVTRKELMDELAKFADQTDPDDTALIFFAGHGLLSEDGQYYFATHDSVFHDKMIKSKTGLSQAELLEGLRAIKAQKLLLILNTCLSGNVAGIGTLGSQPSAVFNASVLATGEGRAIFTAGRSSQPSYFLKTDTHTFFGRALIDGLSGDAPAAPGSQFVGLFELYDHVYDRVKKQADDHQLVQEPVLTLIESVGPFPVALKHGGTGSLGADSIQHDDPTNKAVERVDQNTAKAAGELAESWAKTGGSGISFGSTSISFFNIGGNAKVGSIVTGDMVVGTLTKIYNSASKGNESEGKEELIKLIGNLRDEIQKLADVPKSKRDDTEYLLTKAEEAAKDEDKPGLLDRLQSAEKVLLSIAASVPAALKVGEMVSRVLQTAMTVFK